MFCENFGVNAVQGRRAARMFGDAQLGFAADAPALHVSCSDESAALVTRSSVHVISDGEQNRAFCSVPLDARHGGGRCIAFHPSGGLLAVLVRALSTPAARNLYHACVCRRRGTRLCSFTPCGTPTHTL